MKKLAFISIPLMLLVACTKDISSFNIETKRPAVVPAGTLFSNAVKTLADNYGSASVNTNVFRFTVKHWAMAVYQDEAQYDFSTRGIPQAWWTTMYRDILNDLEESKRITQADATLTAGVKTNRLAEIDIIEVFVYNTLVNTFGDIPYSEALNSNILFPKYDDAKTVSLDLLKRIGQDITALNASSGGFTSIEDILYNGNTTNWIKFANSLRIKMGMVLADVEPAAAKSAVEASAGAGIDATSANAQVTYMTASPNTNPLYTDIVLGGRADYVAAKDLLDTLVALNDPRLSLYYSTNNAGNYQGGVVGKVNTFADMSKPAPRVYAADAPVVLSSYEETQFYLAEAVERGFTVSGTAAEHYNNAIMSSIMWWGGTATAATLYLAQPSVNYATAPGDWRQKIGFQKWIALYNRPFDAWLEYRRLDYPKLPLAQAAKSGFPNRLIYPTNEQQLNGSNYTSAASKVGGDKVETKLFWDKY